MTGTEPEIFDLIECGALEQALKSRDDGSANLEAYLPLLLLRLKDAGARGGGALYDRLMEVAVHNPLADTIQDYLQVAPECCRPLRLGARASSAAADSLATIDESVSANRLLDFETADPARRMKIVIDELQRLLASVAAGARISSSGGGSPEGAGWGSDILGRRSVEPELRCLLPVLLAHAPALETRAVSAALLHTRFGVGLLKAVVMNDPASFEQVVAGICDAADDSLAPLALKQRGIDALLALCALCNATATRVRRYLLERKALPAAVVLATLDVLADEELFVLEVVANNARVAVGGTGNGSSTFLWEYLRGEPQQAELLMSKILAKAASAASSLSPRSSSPSAIAAAAAAAGSSSSSAAAAAAARAASRGAQAAGALCRLLTAASCILLSVGFRPSSSVSPLLLRAAGAAVTLVTAPRVTAETLGSAARVGELAVCLLLAAVRGKGNGKPAGEVSGGLEDAVAALLQRLFAAEAALSVSETPKSSAGMASYPALYAALLLWDARYDLLDEMLQSLLDCVIPPPPQPPPSRADTYGREHNTTSSSSSDSGGSSGTLSVYTGWAGFRAVAIASSPAASDGMQIEEAGADGLTASGGDPTWLSNTTLSRSIAALPPPKGAKRTRQWRPDALRCVWQAMRHLSDDENEKGSQQQQQQQLTSLHHGRSSNFAGGGGGGGGGGGTRSRQGSIDETLEQQRERARSGAASLPAEASQFQHELAVRRDIRQWLFSVIESAKCPLHPVLPQLLSAFACACVPSPLTDPKLKRSVLEPLMPSDVQELCNSIDWTAIFAPDWDLVDGARPLAGRTTLATPPQSAGRASAAFVKGNEACEQRELAKDMKAELVAAVDAALPAMLATFFATKYAQVARARLLPFPAPFQFDFHELPLRRMLQLTAIDGSASALSGGFGPVQQGAPERIGSSDGGSLWAAALHAPLLAAAREECPELFVRQQQLEWTLILSSEKRLLPNGDDEPGASSAFAAAGSSLAHTATSGINLAGNADSAGSHGLQGASGDEMEAEYTQAASAPISSRAAALIPRVSAPAHALTPWEVEAVATSLPNGVRAAMAVLNAMLAAPVRELLSLGETCLLSFLPAIYERTVPSNTTRPLTSLVLALWKRLHAWHPSPPALELTVANLLLRRPGEAVAKRALSYTALAQEPPVLFRCCPGVMQCPDGFAIVLQILRSLLAYSTMLVDMSARKQKAHADLLTATAQRAAKTTATKRQKIDGAAANKSSSGGAGGTGGVASGASSPTKSAPSSSGGGGGGGGSGGGLSSTSSAFVGSAESGQPVPDGNDLLMLQGAIVTRCVLAVCERHLAEALSCDWDGEFGVGGAENPEEAAEPSEFSAQRPINAEGAREGAAAAAFFDGSRGSVGRALVLDRASEFLDGLLEENSEVLHLLLRQGCSDVSLALLVARVPASRCMGRWLVPLLQRPSPVQRAFAVRATALFAARFGVSDAHEACREALRVIGQLAAAAGTRGQASVACLDLLGDAVACVVPMCQAFPSLLGDATALLDRLVKSSEVGLGSSHPKRQRALTARFKTARDRITRRGSSDAGASSATGSAAASSASNAPKRSEVSAP